MAIDPTDRPSRRTSRVLTDERDGRAVDVLLVSDARSPAEIRELAAATTDQGGECLVVSTDTDRGTQFDTALGGLGALLRFPIN